MSGFAEYEHYDALGLADLVRRRRVSADELLDAAIARVENRNPSVNAVVMKLYDNGRQAIKAGLQDGPMTVVCSVWYMLNFGIAMKSLNRPGTGFQRACTMPSAA